MPGSFWHHLKHAPLILCVLLAAAGWLYVIYNEHRSNDPMEIVKKHFVFYPEYSRGAWREGQCLNAGGKKCRDITYTVPIQACGPVTFDWNVFPGDDADTTWAYNGTYPKIDENKYALYAVLNEDSRLIDSPALGTALPAACQAK